MTKLLLAVCVAVFVYAVMTLLFSKQTLEKIGIKKRIAKIYEMGKTKKINDIEERSFRERVVYPTIKNILAFAEKFFPISQEERDKLTGQLMLAGIKSTAGEYATTRALVMIGCVLAGGVIGFAVKGTVLWVGIGAVAGLYIIFTVYRFSLASKMTKRREKIKRQMPELLDLLVVCVEAGLGFDQSIAYIVTKASGELYDEFKIVQRDIGLGRTRKEALQQLCFRCDIDELKTFATAVIQADELGISLKNVLNAQSDAVRIAHKQEFEEKIQKLPVKILIPMVCFIFPVLFIIILGPAVPGIMDAFM